MKDCRACAWLQGKPQERNTNLRADGRLILVNHQLNLRGSSLTLYLTRTARDRRSRILEFRAPGNTCSIVHF